MREDRFYMPVRVYSGRNVVKAHAGDLAALGKKALIVTGRHSAKRCGVYEELCAALDGCGVSHVLFDGVEENPSAATVMNARQLGLEEGCDFVIGAGGGSPMDAAKAIALMIRHAGQGREYLYTAGSDSRTVPVVCIPTTCGTGSEVTAVSVLTDEIRQVKGSIPHKIFPALALIDGKYLAGASRQILCNTAFDALSHLYESFLNADAGPISRLIARDGLREWKKCLPFLRGQTEPDEEVYDLLMRAAMLGGMAIAHTGTSLPHALSYALTSHLGIAHGKAVCYFLAGYLSESDPEEVSELLSLSGFTSIRDLHNTYLQCCGAMDISQDQLDSILQLTEQTVSSNPAKCAKAPFPAGAEVIGRIVSYTKAQARGTYQAVLFDLDGTINDSGPGIMNSVRYSLRKLGHPVPDETTLRRFVGPSLVYSYMTYCGLDEEEAWKAVEAYRECYHAGECFNLHVYDGMTQLLGDLKEAGLRLAVVTSKPQDMACRILEHFHLDRFFDAIVGPDPYDPSNQKSVLIHRALDVLGLDSSEVIMVGDSRFDVIGAKEAGCRSIGVTYGYGTRAELTDNGADDLADTPLAVKEILNL